jgi:plasmid maintenance system antidote protein VapI
MFKVAKQGYPPHSYSKTGCKAQKRREALYNRCLDIVEQRIAAELAINPNILAEILEVRFYLINRILSENDKLRKIVTRCQRLFGIQQECRSPYWVQKRYEREGHRALR